MNITKEKGKTKMSEIYKQLKKKEKQIEAIQKQLNHEEVLDEKMAKEHLILGHKREILKLEIQLLEDS